MRIYLAHPYERREQLKPLVEKIKALGITVIDPFYHTEYAQKLTEKFGEMLKNKEKIAGSKWERIAKLVVAKDLRFIRGCDLLVAVYDGEVDLMIGTPMETMFASHVCEIPVYILLHNADKNPRLSVHCWLLRFSEKIFEDDDELLAAIKEMAEVPEG